MSGNSKRIPKKKPDHESGFYEECPAEDERCTTRSSNSFNVNSRISEDFPTKMKKTIKNIKNNRKKSDIIPPNGFSTPEKKKEEKQPPVTPAIDDYVLILSDGEEEEAASTSNGSNTKENLKMVYPESEKPKPAEEKITASNVTSSLSQSDKELELISRIKNYGGMSISYIFLSFVRTLKNLFMII